MREVGFQPRESFLFCRELPVGLSFIRRVGDFSDMHAGAVVEIRKHVASQDQGRLRFPLDRFRARGGQNARGFGRQARAGPG